MWEPKRGYFCAIDLYVLYGWEKRYEKLECGDNNAIGEKAGTYYVSATYGVYLLWVNIYYMCALWYSKKLFASIVCMCERGGERGLSREKAVFRSAGGVYESCFGSIVRKTVWFYVLMVLTYLLYLHDCPHT